MVHPSPDCSGPVTSEGFNLIGNVGQDNGAAACMLVNSIHDLVGTSSKPLDESKAKNAGDPANCPATDQRRFRRPVGGGCDIGALNSDARPDSTSTPGANPVLTISESTTLESDQKRAIVISRDYALLDCKGHKIEGVDGTGVGIDLKGRTGVIVRNCVVTNFANGFNLEDSLLNVLYRNTASRNRNDGVHIVRSVGNVLDANTVEDNNDDGFDLDVATGNVFRSNVVRANRGSGFTLDYSAANLFANTFSRTNTGRGFQISHASRNNVFVRNSACNNLKPDVEENSNPNAFRMNSFCVLVGIRAGEEF